MTRTNLLLIGVSISLLLSLGIITFSTDITNINAQSSEKHITYIDENNNSYEFHGAHMVLANTVTGVVTDVKITTADNGYTILTNYYDYKKFEPLTGYFTRDLPLTFVTDLGNSNNIVSFEVKNTGETLVFTKITMNEFGTTRDGFAIFPLHRVLALALTDEL
jgi:hypothetical protein